MEVILFIGIPASGKSTFYQVNFCDTHVRINRNMSRTKNRVARHLDLCLEIEQPCILDTNLLRAEPIALLFKSETCNDLPKWQKRGFGVGWENYEKEGWNPLKKERVFTTRRRLKPCLDLPNGEEYSQFLREMCESSSN